MPTGKAAVSIDRAALVDEAGKLETRLAPFSADAKRLEALRKEFRKWADDDKVDGNATTSYQGTKFSVALGRKELKRRIISMAKVLKAIGAKRFVNIVSVTLKDLEAELGAAAAAHISEERTGSRDITITPILAE